MITPVQELTYYTSQLLVITPTTCYMAPVILQFMRAPHLATPNLKGWEKVGNKFLRKIFRSVTLVGSFGIF
jgi:hypothetical protein